MVFRRSILIAAIALSLVPPVGARAAAATDAVATVHAFYDALLQAMKRGPQLGFAGRRDLLAPAVRRAFDLPTMTQITIGPQWASLAPDDRQKLIRAFSDYSIATYANRFDSYSGEKFNVDPKAAPSADGDVIVRSTLQPSQGTPVELDYLMHKSGSGWKIIDVYLSGTISQLASQRSEFTSVMRNGGVTALIQKLQSKTAQLAG